MPKVVKTVTGARKAGAGKVKAEGGRRKAEGGSGKSEDGGLKAAGSGAPEAATKTTKAESKAKKLAGGKVSAPKLSHDRRLIHEGVVLILEMVGHVKSPAFLDWERRLGVKNES